jgi:alpha-glucoside transport system substrate-binding protein
MSRRIAGGAIAVLGLLVAACGNAGSELESEIPVIDVFGPYRGVEADSFADVLRGFEQRAGIEVRYTGSADFVRDLQARLADDAQPDVAIVPQPGLVSELRERGVLVEHGERTQEALDDADNDADVLTAGAADVAVPYRTTIKSLVWYRPEVFEANGWEVPATLDQLVELVERIRRQDDIAPWCFSIASGSATGWPATDWLEDLVLRQHGEEVYDRWRDGGIAFDDSRIREGFETIETLLLGEALVAGGRRSLVQTDVVDTVGPLFGDPPGCAMFKQASFALDWMPEGTTVGDEVDVFVVPGVEAGEPAPLVVGGDSAVAFDDRAEVDALMAYLASPDGGRRWARAGGYLSARADVEIDDYYPDDVVPLVELLREDRVLRFDASDTMEPSFGSGEFWTGMTAWMSNTEPLDDVIAGFDETRAAS